MALYHPEATFQLRRVIMQHASQMFTELEKAEITQLLTHSRERSTMLEAKLEEKFIKQHRYERGGSY